jgi:hypothetical protein
MTKAITNQLRLTCGQCYKTFLGVIFLTLASVVNITKKTKLNHRYLRFVVRVNDFKYFIGV